jgi:hypothetical protein
MWKGWAFPVKGLLFGFRVIVKPGFVCCVSDAVFPSVKENLTCTEVNTHCEALQRVLAAEFPSLTSIIVTP